MSAPGKQQSYELPASTYRQLKVARPWLGSNIQCISQHTTESAHKLPCRLGI